MCWELMYIAHQACVFGMHVARRKLSSHLPANLQAIRFSLGPAVIAAKPYFVRKHSVYSLLSLCSLCSLSSFCSRPSSLEAFEDAVREIDNLGEDGAKDRRSGRSKRLNLSLPQESALVMQLLRDNITLWTEEKGFVFPKILYCFGIQFLLSAAHVEPMLSRTSDPTG